MTRLTAHAIARCREMDLPATDALHLLDGSGPTVPVSRDYPSVTRAGARTVADGRIAVPYVIQPDGSRVGITVLWDGLDQRETSR